MTSRLALIVVSLLTLMVMCGLLLTAIVWVPTRINRLEERLDQLEELSARISVMHNQLSDLDRLEKKLADTALAAAPLARIDSSVDDVNKKLNQVVVPAVNDIKGRITSRSDLDSLVAGINQISRKLAAGSGSGDPELKKLADAVAELKGLMEATHKKLDTTSRKLTRDVKALHLELQKMEAIMKSGTATSKTAAQ